MLYRLQYQPSSNSSSQKGWLIMVGNSTSNPVQLLDPFTNKQLSLTGTHPYDRTTPLKLLNLSNFSLVQLFEPISLVEFQHNVSLSLMEMDMEFLDDFGFPYTTTYTPPDLVKATLFPSLTCQTSDESSSRMVFALYSSGTLSIYAVDKWGAIFSVNCSTLKLVQFSPKLCHFQSKKKKRLVECNGSLYVVDLEYTRVGRNNYEENNFKDMKVYKLDVDHGWLHVEKLDNMVFVLGASCSFSLNVEDYHGCEANCIYLHSHQRIRAFSLETCEFKDPKIFWPCPSLFESRFNL
ncbi:hypothetical protein PIB30_053704 [Stylosanthes scabra]|uniref:KIB1-4 beta-propeller domain-containing protein n=1 Tax=Stylosanthes scabra TaxID=79078 RepID=A0ABU6YGV6_9FABA|nr:hypothetical protein [Stylosanthes scabra]